jgi:hypothetical protein
VGRPMNEVTNGDKYIYMDPKINELIVGGWIH